MIIDLEHLEPNKVSTNIKDYSLLITAESSFGKTPFLYELYGDRALFLTFENSAKGIAGIHTVPVDSYVTLNAYLMQLQKPSLREKYDVIVIDTLFLFDHSIEKSILDTYGKELLSDCISYNKAYKIVDKRFLEAIKKLQKMDYSLAYVCHPTEKKVKLPDGTEYIKYEPKVSDRIKDLLLPEIDIKLFCNYDQNGNKVIYTQSTPFFEARCRVGDMDAVIPFSANALQEAFAEGIERRIQNKDLLVSSIEHKNPTGIKEEERTFEEVMKEIMELGQEFGQMGMAEKANLIVFKVLGSDGNGNQRTLADVNESMLPALEVIVQNLKELKETLVNK